VAEVAPVLQGQELRVETGQLAHGETVTAAAVGQKAGTGMIEGCW
jgi:hypothetical protein